MSKKLATTVYITEQQQALLRELNQRSKVPIAEFIRQGIDLVIHRYRDQLPGQLDLPLGHPLQVHETAALLTPVKES